MTANFAARTAQAATQIRLLSVAASCEAAMKPELGGSCVVHPRDWRRGGDYGNTFERWPV